MTATNCYVCRTRVGSGTVVPSGVRSLSASATDAVESSFNSATMSNRRQRGMLR